MKSAKTDFRRKSETISKISLACEQISKISNMRPKKDFQDFQDFARLRAGVSQTGIISNKPGINRNKFLI